MDSAACAKFLCNSLSLEETQKYSEEHSRLLTVLSILFEKNLSTMIFLDPSQDKEVSYGCLRVESIDFIGATSAKTLPEFLSQLSSITVVFDLYGMKKYNIKEQIADIIQDVIAAKPCVTQPFP